MSYLLILIAVSLISFDSNSFELSTNLYTNHLLSDTYKDKKTGKEKAYNEDNGVYSVWFNVEDEEVLADWDTRTELKYGAGYFTNSFHEEGYFIGMAAEPAIQEYSVKGLGSYESYYSLGFIMTNTYEDMSYMPIPVFSLGVRNQKGSFSVGSYGMAAVMVVNASLKF